VTPVRLGAVGYLNARPLVHGLTPQSAASSESPPGPVFDVRFDVPSVCATLLSEGEIDLGLVPSITYLSRPGDRIVPDVAIASDGSVASVALFTRRPIADVRSIALDTSSRTSVALTRILCVLKFGISPTFSPRPPDLPSMLRDCDAALVIGDPALFVDHRALGLEKIDLGEAWSGLTGLPFVWAFWSGRPGAADDAVVGRLQDARRRGVADAEAIADAYCGDDLRRQAIARHYLREHMKYDLPRRAIEGLTTFYREAAALELVTGTKTIEFF
jgi:chorismate dehydratase